jgi:putative oxidoreductase
MERLLSPFSGLFYAAFRVVTGLMFACHGAQKILGLLGGHAQIGNPRMMLAGGIELLGGLLVAMGLFSSLAAFLACGEMAVAYFTVHAPHGFWPIVNKGELAVLYCFAFLVISAQGPGALSLQALLGDKKKK